MKITALMLIIVFAQTLFGAKPIDEKKHEQISQAMLRLQGARITLLTIKLQQRPWRNELLAAEEFVVEAAEAYNTLLNALRKEHDAEGCVITLEKKWDCPAKPEQKKESKP